MTTRWRGRFASSIAAAFVVIAAGCGDDGGEATSMELATTSIDSSTTSVAGSSGSSGSGGGGETLDAQCDGEESPALAAYDLADGELEWLGCAIESPHRSVVAVTDDLVYSIEQPSERGVNGLPLQRLVAADVQDGAMVWQLELAPAQVPVGPFIGADVAVATVDDPDGRAIVGLDPATGALRWSEPIPETDAALLMTDSVVVVSTESMPEGFTPPTINPTGTLPPDGPLSAWYYRGLDRSSGSEKWHVAVTVTPDAVGGYPGGTVDGDTVILDPAMVALDARSGDELWRMTDQPDNRDRAFGPAADGVVVWGGQGSPTSGVDTSSGEVLWTQPGWPPYSDVWAVGDGAVYVVDMSTSEMVAYELSDGSPRWRQQFDNDRYSWPWQATGDALFAVWTNIDTLSTDDGSTRWSTDYPNAEPPRMTGVGSNDELVVVAFGYESSPGD